jgi:hypothetical protein
VGASLAHGWQALKPQAWMMKFSSLHQYGSLADLMETLPDTVLDEYVFDRAAAEGKTTGGLEDGSYMCLLFDTIRTEAEAEVGLLLATKLTLHRVFATFPTKASLGLEAYLRYFLDKLEAGDEILDSDDSMEEVPPPPAEGAIFWCASLFPSVFSTRSKQKVERPAGK